MEKFSGIFGHTGWICPKCGRVFSPFTTMCPYCKGNDKSNLDKVTSDNTHFSQKKNESRVFPSTRWPSGLNAEMVYKSMYDNSII